MQQKNLEQENMLRILYLIYQICIALPIFLVLTILTALTTMLGCWLGNGHVWGYYPGKMWSRLTCIVCLLPVKVVGRENIKSGTSYVFVANHQGAFDIFLVYGYLNRNFKWMLKKSLRKIPLVGKACESAGFIFVDKSRPRAIVNSIRNAERILQGGTSMVVFPEGSRTYTGHLGEFHKGAFFMADQLQLPVIPLTIDGSFDVLPRFGKTLHWHRMKLTIHPAIMPKGKGGENLDLLIQESYEVINSALPERHKNHIEHES